MTTTLIVGPAASGKTQRCLEGITRIRQENPRATIWTVLPNRAQVVAFRRRFASSGGGLGVRIETVQAFVEELTIRLGCQRPRAANSVRRRLIQAALLQLAEADSIPHYASIAGTAGFSHLLSDRFQELKRGGWRPQALEKVLATEGQQAIELGRIFRAYQQGLEELGWEDDEGLAQLAADTLPEHPQALEEVAAVLFDGFDSFSNNQLALLSALNQTGTNLMVTLPSRRSQGHDFDRYSQSFDEVSKALPEAKIEELVQAGHQAPALASLGNYLFTPAAAADSKTEPVIEWRRARSINAEVRQALGWLKSLVVRDELSLQDCGLILTEPESYEPFVREVAAEYGIPLRFGLGRQLQAAPSMVALLDLLQLPLNHWKRRLTLEAVRSPFFDLSAFEFAAEDALKLEAASYWGQVVEGVDQWSQALSALASRELQNDAQEELEAPIQLPSAAEAARLENSLRSFAQRLAPGEPKSISGWVLWLEDLLQDLDFFDRVNTIQERAAAMRLREVLRAMLLSEKVLGTDRMNYREFIAELEGSIEQARYQPKPDWDRAALQVEGLEAARGLRFVAVALVGLSEGQLPAIEREDPLLPDSLRSQLGLEPRIGRDQPSLFYSGISRADQRLMLSRPTLAQDGESWEPSPYWRASLEVYGRQDQSVPLARRGAERPMSEAASPQEVTFLAVRRRSLPAAYKQLETRLEPLRRSRQLIEARLREPAAGAFEGELAELADYFKERLGSDHLWSPSRLESFGTCPHFYLTSNLLGLEQLEEPRLGPDPSQLGSLLHEILEFAYQAADDPTEPEAVLKEVRRVAAAEFERAPEKFGFRPSPLWQVESARFLVSLEECVMGLAEEGAGWRPIGYEAIFGLGGEPPLQVDTEEGPVLVRGVIDRVDQQGDRIRVIDYKTGSSHLNRGDLIEGRRLQLPLYALAAEKSLDLGEVSAGMYWAILSAKAGGLRLERFYADLGHERLEGVEGAYQMLRRHLARFLAAMRSGQFQPQPPNGGCPSYCPAMNWCWRYTPGFRR